MSLIYVLKQGHIIDYCPMGGMLLHREENCYAPIINSVFTRKHLVRL